MNDDLRASQDGVSQEKKVIAFDELVSSFSGKIAKHGIANFFNRPIPDDYRKLSKKNLKEVYKKDESVSENLFIFSLGGLLFAVPARAIELVDDCLEICKLPYFSNECLRGVINVKGEVYPAISIFPFLFPKRDEANLAFRQILLFGNAENKSAVLVEEVFAVYSTDLTKLDATSDQFLNVSDLFVRGSFKFKDKDVGLLDAQLLTQKIREFYK